MEVRDTIYSTIVLTLALVWATCCPAAEKPPQAPPIRKCFCDPCNCGPDCKCAGGECRCEGCQVKAEPVRLVLFTAVDYCVPCAAIAPHWKQVSEENPGLCETIDLSDFDAPVAEHPRAKEYGVTSVPTLVRVVDSKADKTSKIGDVDTLPAMRDVVRRWRAGE